MESEKKEKQLWNKKEVIGLLTNCCAEIYSEDGTLKGKSPSELYKWIEKNVG